MSETITVVPTVKAYPALSSKLEEFVCVAGFAVRLLEQPRWVRLFPVPFRELDLEQQFHKWQPITLDVEPSSNDRRPESLRPVSHTIQTGALLRSRDRRRLVASMPHMSMCDLIAQQQLDGTSLGVIRPREVIDVIVVERDDDEVRKHQERAAAIANQQKLFGPELAPLEAIPHRFVYQYLCEHPHCGLHNQGIIDWEISAAYRKWRGSYPDNFIDRIRNKWLDELCGPDRDTRFFVGNMHQHPSSFLVLGVFSPKR